MASWPRFDSFRFKGLREPGPRGSRLQVDHDRRSPPSSANFPRTANLRDSVLNRNLTNLVSGNRHRAPNSCTAASLRPHAKSVTADHDRVSAPGKDCPREWPAPSLVSRTGRCRSSVSSAVTARAVHLPAGRTMRAAISIMRQASRWTRSGCISACAAVLSRIAEPSASRSPATMHRAIVLLPRAGLRDARSRPRAVPGHAPLSRGWPTSCAAARDR